MRHAAASCACVFGLFTMTMGAQDSKPNFSGNWRLTKFREK
jgi:hypothetical protein